MAVVKLSGSEKALLFIDDRGYMYSIPKHHVQNLIFQGEANDWRVVNLVPFRTDVSKYPTSKVFTAGELYEIGEAVQKGLVEESFKKDTTDKQPSLEKKPESSSDNVDDISVDW